MIKLLAQIKVVREPQPAQVFAPAVSAILLVILEAVVSQVLSGILSTPNLPVTPP